MVCSSTTAILVHEGTILIGRNHSSPQGKLKSSSSKPNMKEVAVGTSRRARRRVRVYMTVVGVFPIRQRLTFFFLQQPNRVSIHLRLQRHPKSNYLLALLGIGIYINHQAHLCHLEVQCILALPMPQYQASMSPLPWTILASALPLPPSFVGSVAICLAGAARVPHCD